MTTKQEIKCPNCNEVFPIQEGFKHQTEELRKKLETDIKHTALLKTTMKYPKFQYN